MTSYAHRIKLSTTVDCTCIAIKDIIIVSTTVIQRRAGGLEGVDSDTKKLRFLLWSMARGQDVWEDFLGLVGPFIYHILKEDYCFYEEYDEHTRHEILHDIYLRVAKYSGGTAGRLDFDAYKAYLRKTIRTVMTNKRRILARWNREISLESLSDRTVKTALPHVPDPVTWFEEKWRSRSVTPAVKAAIARVAAHSRESTKTERILLRRLVEGSGYEEIAEDAGIGVDAVRHVVHYYSERVIDEARAILGVKGEVT